MLRCLVVFSLMVPGKSCTYDTLTGSARCFCVRDRQGASACGMQSEGFLQTMKTVSFSGLCRSQRLVLSYQGTPHAELCDASRYQDISSAENLRKLVAIHSSLLKDAVLPRDEAIHSQCASSMITASVRPLSS